MYEFHIFNILLTAMQRSLTVLLGGNTADDLEFVSTLEFRTFYENLRCLYSPYPPPRRHKETQEEEIVMFLNLFGGKEGNSYSGSQLT